MARKILYVVAFTGLSLAVLAYAITRPGELVTPTGSGTVTIDGQTFEAFPLPDYVTSIAGGDYLSYLIEVEPCLLYTSPSPRDVEESRMPSSA